MSAHAVAINTILAYRLPRGAGLTFQIHGLMFGVIALRRKGGPSVHRFALHMAAVGNTKRARMAQRAERKRPRQGNFIRVAEMDTYITDRPPAPDDAVVPESARTDLVLQTAVTPTPGKESKRVTV